MEKTVSGKIGNMLSDYSYSDNFPRKMESKTKPTNKIKLLMAVFILILIPVVFIRTYSPPLLNPVVESGGKAKTAPKNKTFKNLNFEEIKTAINKELESASGTYSIFYQNLADGMSFGMNENIVLDAASVNKIPILAALYHLAGKGEIDLNRTIVPQSKDIQDYGTGSIRYDKPGTSYSIKTLARLMMEKSDNTAAYLLGSQIVGLNTIQELIEGWGAKATDMKKNTSTVRDISIILTKMYKGQVTDPTLTKEMIGLMDDSDFEDRLTRGLDSGTKIYHKTGDQTVKVHDAGIIEIPGKNYYLGIFTTDVKDVPIAKENIAAISKIVYDAVIKL